MSDNSNSFSEMKETQAIQADAKRLAEKYHVDASRVADILAKTRITEEWNPIAGYKYVEKKVRDRARYWPLLEDALQEMGEKALGLFEEVAPDILSDRLLWLYRLMWNDLPVYTREGLIRLTEAFIKNQHENKASLIATGYREKILWEKFPWLEERLGNLYPTKSPASIEPAMENPGKLNYAWATHDNEPCPYENAPTYDVLDDELAWAIEQSRPELFDLRLEALGRLLTALRDEQFDDPENRMYQEIIDLFNDQHIDILVLTDNLISGKGKIPNAKPGGRKHINSTGGLTDILEVSRHYIAESKAELYHNTKEVLWNSYSESNNGAPQFASTPFSAMQQVDPKDCYAIFGELVSVLVEQNQLTDDMKLSTISALAKRLPNMQSGVEPYLDNILSPVVNQLKASIDDSNLEGNIFIRCEGIWKVRYEGRKVIIPDLKGLCYIALLLDKPDTYHPALKILAGCKQISATASQEEQDAIYEDLPENFIPHDSGYDDLADDDTIRKVKDERRKVVGQIKKLGKDKNADVAELKEKLEAIDKYLNQVAYTDGTSRRTGKVKDKAKLNVSQNIRRTRERIRDDYYPALGEHLIKFIKLDLDWSYRPRVMIEWKVRI